MSLQLSKKKTHYSVSIPEEAEAVASVGTVSQISLEQVVALKTGSGHRASCINGTRRASARIIC